MNCTLWSQEFIIKPDNISTEYESKKATKFLNVFEAQL